ncbi:hypothetical protein SNE40_007869 [Patella caerulea]|uniref:Mitochondrial carrier homolog 2 n=1 Tax=Patella caerulea TaxID=87958 RepID=A0AAN8JYJ5_PATCE
MAAMLAAQYGLGATVTATLHPIGYAKVLMQVGFEPLQPQPSVSLFGKEQWVYPNIFKYVGHIRKVDGFWGLYRGVIPRVISGTIGNAIQNNLHDAFKESNKKAKQLAPAQLSGNEDQLVTWLSEFCKETSQETVARCVGIIVGHPFHVIMLRSMIQFVGRETKYDSIFSSIAEIYRNDGILGYFAGLLPRLVGEIITVWITNFLAQLINKYIVQEKDMQSYTAAACGLIVSHITYPFVLVSNVVAVNGSGLMAASPPRMPYYENSFDCWKSLHAQNQLKRGSSLFWRYYHGNKVVRGISRYN